MAKNEVAVQQEKVFDLVTISGELAEAVAEEMDGLGSIPFDRVKVPSGGGIAFEVPGEDEGSPDIVKEIVGVILHHHPVNAYWKEKYSGDNAQPDCSSFDGKTGIDRETGECKDCSACPFNQYGTSVNDDGSAGKGKACKNVHRVYILLEGNPVPIILSLPPTSLKYMRDYIGKRILLKGMRCYDAVTKITLKKDKSAGGIEFSRTAFELVGKLNPEQRAMAKEMADTVKAEDQNVEIDNSDYNQGSATQQAQKPAAGDGFMNVPDGIDEDLPFN